MPGKIISWDFSVWDKNPKKPHGIEKSKKCPRLKPSKNERKNPYCLKIPKWSIATFFKSMMFDWSFSGKIPVSLCISLFSVRFSQTPGILYNFPITKILYRPNLLNTWGKTAVWDTSYNLLYMADNINSRKLPHPQVSEKPYVLAKKKKPLSIDSPQPLTIKVKFFCLNYVKSIRSNHRLIVIYYIITYIIV